MHVLIAFGSKRGGTEGLARTIAATLEREGHAVDVRPGRTVDGLGGYDAVIVGGGLYADRWARDARVFVRRHRDELRRLPVWAFSSGPLDDSASASAIAMTEPVAALLDDVQVRAHATFGGRLAPDAKGFIAGAMVRQGRGGDFRDMDEVAAWARDIAHVLAHLPTRSGAATPRAQRVGRRALAGLCWFAAVSAIAGGLELMIWPEGNAYIPPASLLEGTPFTTYSLPGLLLAAVVGLVSLFGALLARRRELAGDLAPLFAGITMAVWILVEVAMLGLHVLHVIYLGVGLATTGLAGGLMAARRRALADLR